METVLLSSSRRRDKKYMNSSSHHGLQLSPSIPAVWVKRKGLRGLVQTVEAVAGAAPLAGVAEAGAGMDLGTFAKETALEVHRWVDSHQCVSSAQPVLNLIALASVLLIA